MFYEIYISYSPVYQARFYLELVFKTAEYVSY